MDCIEIQVHRGDSEGFGFLAIDSPLDYTDTQRLPAAGQSTDWKYRSIYRKATTGCANAR